MAKLNASVKEAKQFVKDWTGRGDEKQDTQAFWIQLLDKVFGDHNYNKDIQFEQTADKIEGGKFFKDAVIYRHTDRTVLVEQKGMKYALDQKEPRHGLMLTPFEQAKEYDDKSSYNDKARWIITCNFKEFWIYDMTKTGKDLYTPAAKLALEDLPKRLDWLSMLEPENQPVPTFTEEVDVSVKAGELVGILYNDLHKNYKNPDDQETLRQLNILCVRIVFCLYAEDAGLFDKNNRKMFHDYLAQFDARGMRRALSDLFKVLDQKEEDRDPYLADDNPMLAAFPYVNGGLFEGDVVIPPFTDETVDILLNKESEGFDWSKISPTIFGAVFESTLNQETRRAGGMHYTSIENIHKVIDPLFLDDLNEELDSILSLKTPNTRNNRLKEFQKRLSQIRCFDPACGSGNFLTESYLSLRRLENKALKAQLGQKIAFGFDGSDLDPIQVSIQQFYGIEINDFAVSVAKTALWIAEAQMFEETQSILNDNKDFLPLETFTNIHEGNALQIDWNTIIDRRTEHLYIIGNPPFSGTKKMGVSQKADTKYILGEYKNYGTLDYVSCWYKKSVDFLKNTKNSAAFVSTNSICQGEQVINLWKPLFAEGMIINFAYTSFEWSSEATSKAGITCIIIGFSCSDLGFNKFIDDNDKKKYVSHINGYLLPGNNIFIENRRSPISNVPPIFMGCKPLDGGHYVMTEQQKNDFLSEEPQAKPLIRPYMMGKDFINRKPRYIIWLQGADVTLIKSCPHVMERIKSVREFRQNCDSPDTNKYANRPMLPARLSYYSVPRNKNAIAIPKVTTLNRKYIPMDYLPPDIISGDKLFMMPNALLFHFGVLMSSVHNAWVRVVAGRMRDSGYSYSNTLVYNNFPWPSPNEKQYEKIEKTAQGILNARNAYPNSTFNELYDPDNEFLYPILNDAHEANDKAVMDAYGFDKNMTEPEIVAELMKMYQKLKN